MNLKGVLHSDKMVEAYRRYRGGNSQRPIHSFLLIGQNIEGVGLGKAAYSKWVAQNVLCSIDQFLFHAVAFLSHIGFEFGSPLLQ
jgi:hypothetical protein